MTESQTLADISSNATKKYNEFQAYLKEQELSLQRVKRIITQKEKELERIGDFVSSNSKIDKEKFMAFMKKPYKIQRISSNKYHVYVPKWVPGFQIGWMIDEGVDDEFFTYEINRYSSKLGEVPPEIAEKLDLAAKIEAKVKEGHVVFDKQTVAEDLFKGHIKRWGVNEADVIQGHEFDVILKIIESGGIPYEQHPVEQEDMRTPQVNFELYDYQKDATKLFKKTGAVGVFYPTGAGKSMIAMYGMDSVNGKKILVTKKTLIDQWRFYFEKYAPRLTSETWLVTYEYLRNHPEIVKQEFAVAVFDECHRLPANSFAKLSLIRAKYRLGLSASPHREDGNEKMIFALTGYPIGLDWKSYMDTVKRKFHPIYLHIVANSSQKINRINKLWNPNKKTLIFSDSINLGDQIARKYNLPHVHGQTENRMEILKERDCCVVSRVGDEGISLDNLQRIIEVDFLYGSRGQEIQRTGRLMHSEKAERHDIIMTEREFEAYGKRIWVLQEKGFHVTIKD